LLSIMVPVRLVQGASNASANDSPEVVVLEPLAKVLAVVTGPAVTLVLTTSRSSAAKIRPAAASFAICAPASLTSFGVGLGTGRVILAVNQALAMVTARASSPLPAQPGPSRV